MQNELVVFCAVLGITAAALALGKPDPKPEQFKDVEGCYKEELNEVIPFGESRPSPTGCLEYRCGVNWVQYVSCGAVLVSPPYKLVQHKEKPYPLCCPMIEQILSTPSQEPQVETEALPTEV